MFDSSLYEEFVGLCYVSSVVNIIVGSSYALIKDLTDYFYKSTGDYYDETEKATENYRALIVESFGLER